APPAGRRTGGRLRRGGDPPRNRGSGPAGAEDRREHAPEDRARPQAGGEEPRAGGHRASRHRGCAPPRRRAAPYGGGETGRRGPGARGGDDGGGEKEAEPYGLKSPPSFG